MPQREAARGNTPIPSKRLPSLMSAAILPQPFHGQDSVKGGGGDPQPPGHRYVVLHVLVHVPAADHQHMGAPEQVPAHVNPGLVLFGYAVVEEQRHVEDGADGGEARLVCHAAVAGSHLCDGVEEHIFVLRGTLRLVLGDKTVDVGEKQAVRFRADIPHSYQNLGKCGCAVYNTIFYPHH
ncbi:cupin domain-containing protein [Acutalibacter muris]|nr:hypothetical protein A4V00_19565 [Hungateiclostridiaceae bacterium KB18]QQR28704.1 cupin domain-containing protein [Acutalibacter muris]